MKIKTNLIFSITALVLLVALAGIGVVAAITSSFTISNKIIYKSTDVFYSVNANIYSMSKETFDSYQDNIYELVNAQQGNEITETYTGNFDGKNNNSPKENEVWEIPDGDLRFTTTKRILVYVFEITNCSANDSVTVDITLPKDVNTNITNTKSTVNEPLVLGTSSSQTSTGIVYVVCECNSIENNFEVSNPITVNIDKFVADN